MTTGRLLLIVAVSLVGAAVCAWQACRACREPFRIIADARAGFLDGGQHDVGPDNLQLLEDTDTYLAEYVAEDSDLWDVFGPDVPVPNLTAHPDFTAGLDRLRQAIRDEQQNGGPTS